VSLPPALVIAAQLLMGILFGLVGLVLATPLAAVAMTLINSLYIKDYLSHDERRD
jgi:predicted PurR-regulated permease PerM